MRRRGTLCSIRRDPPGAAFLEAASVGLFGTSMGRANDDPQLTMHADILRCYDTAIALAEAAESRREVAPV